MWEIFIWALIVVASCEQLVLVYSQKKKVGAGGGRWCQTPVYFWSQRSLNFIEIIFYINEISNIWHVSASQKSKRTLAYLSILASWFHKWNCASHAYDLKLCISYIRPACGPNKMLLYVLQPQTHAIGGPSRAPFIQHRLLPLRHRCPTLPQVRTPIRHYCACRGSYRAQKDH
jgi:hypothetical protein